MINCVFIITIPFGLQSFKLASLSFWPVGRRGYRSRWRGSRESTMPRKSSTRSVQKVAAQALWPQNEPVTAARQQLGPRFWRSACL
ncbi:YccF domain-containing protein [Rhizobium leguminosarum]|uniref:YccF domain-containing protein n=1 Tax=Rhizobium leguminosarum TaxID=384 RepID=UPI0028F44F02|nr:YccF domain-containing protein [Rhizobium leguminosarum]